ncbi:prephenate dehydrogenase/arogenate dehydrogenase family protein [Couchioplanes caeruleus]|uniref:prephenate dehydrogenase n=1 Tax=Couchioplanes caeruleus TaxID=56438 RepID=UPI00201C9228|nr:prephenate dehydrogenase/arogenate dehydrogenase family protein [Couchioplanes caeruleus]UQU65179.1 prephenate dehydrogenase/arogenate dehydrogenase family protein [Couchioplanes caeruleus]
MNVAVIGLGLIGGSLLRALAARGHHVTGYDVSEATRHAAAEAAAEPGADGLGWRVAADIPDAVADAELVVLAVPLPALPVVTADLAGFTGLITDVTSVKGPVRDLLKGRRYVGGHPMAGKESSSFLASDPDLFDGCAWVLCLEPGETELDDWLRLAALYTSIGARVVPATADEHDEAVARISHVPHLLAAALSGLIEGNPLAGALAAGSFRDGTRVAATRAELIAAMCGGNAAAVRRVLAEVLDRLEACDAELASPDPVAALTSSLRRPGELRRAWPVAGGVTVRVDREAGALLNLGRAGGWLTDAGPDLVGQRPGTDRNDS